MSFINDLENKIDIVDLVSRYCKLKKAWANYKALCPFPWHDEKTPSFVASPAKQLWYCFWCHRWWWPLKFIMDIENCSFKEAVEILANITNTPLEGFKSEDKDTKTVYNLFRDAWEFYTSQLEKFPEMKKYFFDRGLNDENIKTFWLWFSSSWIELFSYLTKKWYTPELIEKSWIFVDTKTKKDKFINRVIFSIKNLRWEIVWFAGRVVDKSLPKYINSPASNIYDKSSILYGLSEAKTNITKKDHIIITEGYMDTISLHKAWINTAVAVSWTALTQKHIPIIKRLTKRIYLCFDNDKAWINATKLSLDLLKNNDLEVKIIDLKNYNDPDELIKAWENMEDYIKSALSPVWFYINNYKKEGDLNSLTEKKELLKTLLDIIKWYEDLIERDMYLKEISKTLDINIDSLYAKVTQTRTKRQNKEKTIKKSPFTIQDYITAYCIISKQYSEVIDSKLLFKENLSKDLQNILKDSSSFSSFDEESKAKISALVMKIEEKESEQNKEAKEKDLLAIIDKANKSIFEKFEQTLMQKMKEEPDNIEILEKYASLVKKAKENWLK